LKAAPDPGCGCSPPYTSPWRPRDAEPATSNDHIERANTQFWNPPSLEELMADVAPLEPSEHFDIPDLTDEEWDAFVAALDE
jgi:hypothetical protein